MSLISTHVVVGGLMHVMKALNNSHLVVLNFALSAILKVAVALVLAFHDLVELVCK